MPTTNEQLVEVVHLVNELINWALSDLEGSLEAKAKEQAALDRRRYRDLLKAQELLKQCFK